MKENKVNSNFFMKLAEIKKEIRQCVQNGEDYKGIEERYGVKFAKPL